MKIELQNNNQDCLLACYSMILSFYGSDVPVYELYHDDFIQPDGLSIGYLEKLNNKYKLNMQVLKGDNKDVILALNKTKAPLIVQWDQNHFVIVQKIIKNKVKIIDPSIGQEKIDIVEFKKHFSNYIINLYPKKNYKKVPKKYKKIESFKKIFSKSNIFLYLLSLILTQSITLFFSYIIKIILDSKGKSNLLIFIILFSIIFRIIAWFVEQKTQSITNLEYENNLSKKIYHAIFSRPILYFMNNTPGTILEKINLRLIIRDSILFKIFPSTIDSLSFIVLMCYLFKISWILSSVLLFIIIAFSIFNYFIYKNKLVKNNEYITNLINLSGTIQSDLSKIKQIKSEGLERFHLNHWINQSQKLQFKYNNILKINSLSGLVKQLFLFSAIIATVYVGIKLVSLNLISMTDLILFQGLVSMVIVSANQIQDSVFELGNINIYFNKISELFNISRNKNEYYQIDKSNIALLAENISVGYQNKMIFDNVNLQIKKGEKIAIIGDSGAGKTTILFTLLNLLNHKGKIYTGINKIRSKTGVVLQHGELQKGSFLQNILKNNYNFDEAMEVIKDVNLYDLINSFPKKLNSYIFDKGSNLSGGQIQRILMARSLIKNELIVWDEPFNNLDNSSKNKIYNNVICHSKYKDRTFLIISHQLDIVDKVDKIIFLNKSKNKIEFGTHNYLYENSSEYKDFVGDKVCKKALLR